MLREQTSINIEDFVYNAIESVINKEIFPLFEISQIKAVIPVNRENGDYSVNIPVRISSMTNLSAQYIAERIIENIKTDERYIKEIRFAEPCFINFYFTQEWFYDVLKYSDGQRIKFRKTDGEVKEEEIFYMKHTHAYINRMLKQSENKGYKIPNRDSAQLDLLILEEERNIIYEMSKLYMTENNVKNIFCMTYEICLSFNLYRKKFDMQSDSQKLTEARMFFMNCIKTLVRRVLEILNIEAPDKL